MERSQDSLKKQHPVPQNIMEVEFKLVGDMTLRQFGYVAGGAIIGFIIYSQPLPSVIRWPLIFLVATVALGMAFVPIEERGLDTWIKNFFIASYSPTQRVWKEEPAPSRKPVETKKNKKEEKKATTAKSGDVKRKKVEKLGKELQEKIEETKKEKSKSEEDLTKKASEVSKNLDQILAALGKKSEKDLSAKELRKENMLLKKRLATIGDKYKKLKELEGAEETPANLKQTIKYYKDQMETLKEKNRALEKGLQEKEGKGSKRKKDAEGKEKSELKKHIQNLKKQNKELEKKLSTLKESVNNLKEKSAQLEKESTAYEEELAEKGKEIQNLESGRNRAVSRMMEMKKQLEDLAEARQSADPTKQKSDEEDVQKKRVAKSTKETKSKRDMEEGEEITPIIDNVPNIINGIVKDASGNLVEGQMIIIEDKEGDPVRALKTNSLGQFTVSTPLPNGNYTVKVSESGYTPVKVVTEGSVLEPIVFKKNEN